MDTINTTTPPFVTNTFLGTSFTNTPNDLINIRLEPTVSGVFKIDDDIILFFDEQVISGSGDIVISSDIDTRHINIEDASQVAFDVLPIITGFGSSGRHLEFGTLIINPTDDLVSGTTYTVEMASGVITDTDGSPYAGFSDASFTTIDALSVATVGASEVDSTIG